MSSSGSDRFVIVRQRAGFMVKAFVTDNYSYLERYGRRAAVKRCRPSQKHQRQKKHQQGGGSNAHPRHRH